MTENQIDKIIKALEAIASNVGGICLFLLVLCIITCTR